MPKKKTNILTVSHVKEKFSKKSTKAKKKVLSDAPEDHYFILCSGQVIKNLKELADSLESMDDGVFWHHVNSDRNDFSNWIKDIFEDEKLANELASVKDKCNTRIIIYKYLLDCFK